MPTLRFQSLGDQASIGSPSWPRTHLWSLELTMEYCVGPPASASPSAGIKAWTTTTCLASLCPQNPSCSPPPSRDLKVLRPQALPPPRTRDPLILLRAGAALTHVSHPEAGRHPASGPGPCGPVARNCASLRSRARRESAPEAPPAYTLPRRPGARIRVFLRPVSSFRPPRGRGFHSERGVASTRMPEALLTRTLKARSVGRIAPLFNKTA